ncbi:uncharacterized protein UV8b_02714 [Ustilaginoidea virens]|uniref:DUF3835 domain-containing protein n=1 Tax=Ustilaginoidea virens TaxID=1159556 RepID=A0A8E5HNF2_USTVR|nr:uncharacterized protein UV8b_02714 [Ustilaginoidea virens]QUC18473.1 hypothetical protein UV8b_02714 [Ustilaginoidea virens]
MSAPQDSLSNLEKHRLQLEENVNQLKQALQHWQTWDAEYEALKEEVEAVAEPCTPARLQKVHHDFDAQLLTGKEIDQVFGLHYSKPRHQIINLLQRRIDYVGKNVANLQSQLETAQDQYAAATAASQSDAVDENDQPVTEIIEELDDNDNVLSYRLNQPADFLPRVREVLEEAGVDGLAPQNAGAGDENTKTTKTTRTTRTTTLSAPPPSSSQSGTDPVSEPQTKSLHQPPPQDPLTAPPVEKSVAFSEDVDVDAQPSDAASADMSIRFKRLDRIMKTAKEQQESISKDQPVIPDDEDAEDASLRQEMLQYCMGEVGAVVAELELEQGDSDSGFEHDEDEYDEEYDDDDDAYDTDEDKYGRSTGRLVTDKYRQRMLELEKKLGIKSRFTEQAAEQAERDADGESPQSEAGVGRIVVNRDPEPAISSASRPAPSKSNIKNSKNGDAENKKGVRFAQALDVAPQAEPTTQQMQQPPKSSGPPAIDPLSDVVERTGSTKMAATKSSPTPSRFKKARAGTESNGVSKGPHDVPPRYMRQEQRTRPAGPDGVTIIDTLVEHEPSENATAPDEFDDSMVYQEVADTYQRMRRKFIHRDGGFLREDESAIQPLDEADGDEKVSRFKAARLSRQ